jgi:hypothetical protein
MLRKSGLFALDLSGMERLTLREKDASIVTHFASEFPALSARQCPLAHQWRAIAETGKNCRLTKTAKAGTRDRKPQEMLRHGAAAALQN